MKINYKLTHINVTLGGRDIPELYITKSTKEIFHEIIDSLIELSNVSNLRFTKNDEMIYTITFSLDGKYKEITLSPIMVGDRFEPLSLMDNLKSD